MLLYSVASPYTPYTIGLCSSLDFVSLYSNTVSVVNMTVSSLGEKHSTVYENNMNEQNRVD